MLKIINNPDEYIYTTLSDLIETNGGYCVTHLDEIPENKCMCDRFKRQYIEGKTGQCDCGRYIIIKTKEENN